MSHIVRPATSRDAAAVAAVYNHYVLETVITFEEEAVTPDAMAARIERVGATHPWLVLERSGTVAGYAYAAAWHSRCAYRLTTETTVYVEAGRLRNGYGRALYGALLEELRKRSFHAAIGGIALPNEGSTALHERLGFGQVAHFKEVGWKLGRWVDVGYWELIL